MDLLNWSEHFNLPPNPGLGRRVVEPYPADPGVDVCRAR
jgi:hypothetical protein